jgi:hypothetical protein
MRSESSHLGGQSGDDLLGRSPNFGYGLGERRPGDSAYTNGNDRKTVQTSPGLQRASLILHSRL